MTYRDANTILRHHKYKAKSKPTVEEVQSAYDAFGIKTFHTICRDCSRFNGTCIIFHGQWWMTEKVAVCNFFKPCKKESNNDH